MPISHLMLALLVAVIWGLNFLFVKLSLDEIPPLLLCTIRFIFASIPLVLFMKPPKIPFKIVVSYGLLMFALQFGLLFLGMKVGMTPGMASLLVQVQVFFSMFFAAVLLHEKPTVAQIVGAIVAFMGIALVGFHFDRNISLLGFVCILAAAAIWGIGNLLSKSFKDINMMALVVWGSFVAIFPMLILSLIFEGPTQIRESYNLLTWTGIGSLFYIVYLSTWVGYGIWNWLLSRYPVGSVVPFTLLVPIIGVLSSSVFLNEPIQAWKIVAGIFVMSGLCINQLGSRFHASIRASLHSRIPFRERRREG